MTRRVIDFGGSSKKGVTDAFRSVVADSTFRIFVLPTSREDALDYEAFDGCLDDALKTFGEGRHCSVQIQGTQGSTLLGGIYRPCFANGELADWSGSVEGLDEDAAERAFLELQSAEGIGYVALGGDESPDFLAEHITVDTFPWRDWRLLAGAVRNEDGQWTVRQSEPPDSVHE